MMGFITQYADYVVPRGFEGVCRKLDGAGGHMLTDYDNLWIVVVRKMDPRASKNDASVLVLMMMIRQMTKKNFGWGSTDIQRFPSGSGIRGKIDSISQFDGV